MISGMENIGRELGPDACLKRNVVPDGTLALPNGFGHKQIARKLGPCARLMSYVVPGVALPP